MFLKNVFKNYESKKKFLGNLESSQNEVEIKTICGQSFFGRVENSEYYKGKEIQYFILIEKNTNEVKKLSYEFFKEARIY